MQLFKSSQPINLFGLDTLFFSQWRNYRTIEFTSRGVLLRQKIIWDTDSLFAKTSWHFHVSKLLLCNELKWLWHTKLKKHSWIFILHSSSVPDSRRENENNVVHFLSLWKGLCIVIICNLQYYWNLAVCRSAFCQHFSSLLQEIYQQEFGWTMFTYIYLNTCLC